MGLLQQVWNSALMAVKATTRRSRLASAGLAGSTLKFLFFPEIADIYIFPLILLLALAGSFLGCLLSAPVDDATLVEFRRAHSPSALPWGKRTTQ